MAGCGYARAGQISINVRLLWKFPNNPAHLQLMNDDREEKAKERAMMSFSIFSCLFLLPELGFHPTDSLVEAMSASENVPGSRGGFMAAFF